MKTKFSLLILVSFMWATLPVSAQLPPLTQWQKCLGGNSIDNATSIQQTADSGYIVAGYTYSINGDVSGNHGNYDFWVVKLNAAGSLVWQKCLGGSDIDEALNVIQTSDGGYFVSGLSSSSDGDVTGNHGSDDVWVTKLDDAGGLTWQKSLGGSSHDVCNSARQTSDGGYILCGYTNSIDGDVTGNQGSDDCWVVKLSSIGDLLWQKCLGGTDAEFGEEINETSDHGFIVVAVTYSNDGDVSFNHGNDDYWVVKLDSTGAITWDNSFGGSGFDSPGSIQQTTDGGYIVAGTSSSTDGDVTVNLGSSDYWVVKIDASGNLDWQKSFGGSLQDYANSVQQTVSGFIVAGRSYSDDGDITGHFGLGDFWVVHMDESGNLEWQRSLGGTNTDEAFNVIQTIDTGFVVAGYSTSNDGDVSGNHGNGDFWVIKLLNPSCQLYYQDADGDGYGNSLVIDTFCNGLPSGWVTNDLDCDDADASVSPSGIEVCNLIDDNCNSETDEGVESVFYFDNDGDGYGDVTSTTTGCSAPSGYVADSTDCNDVKVQIHPGAAEECNSVDDNCNGDIDEGLAAEVYFQDADGDGYGNPLVSDSACDGAPLGFVIDNTDCDDTNGSINPGVLEIPNNGIDDNCNGVVDEFGVGINAITSLADFSIYPNPAHDQTTIEFSVGVLTDNLPASSHIYIAVYDLGGKEITTLVNEDLQRGEHSFILNTANFSKGVYMVKVTGDLIAANRKLIVE